MKIPQMKSIITRNKNDIAFFIGNGINKHFNASVASWDDLLLDLWDRYSFVTKSVVPSGISLTEFYDVLEMQSSVEGKFTNTLQREVKELLSKWKPDNRQNLVLERIKRLNKPILTTNFDDLIPQSMRLDFYKIGNKRSSDFYPWSSYYSDRALNIPTDGFGIWYINGMAKYHRSIKLGLSHYMNNVSHAKKLFPLNHGEKSLMDSPNWSGHNTWLNIFFNKSLFIFGLGLEENEVFLRWLLLQRAKYYRKYPHTKKNGWYLMKSDKDAESNEGKRFFLESVGIEVLIVDEYEDIYENLWT